MTREEWLAAYAALQPEQARVNALFEAANEGRGSYSEADTARFDINERYTDLAHAAAEIFGGLS